MCKTNNTDDGVEQQTQMLDYVVNTAHAGMPLKSVVAITQCRGRGCGDGCKNCPNHPKKGQTEQKNT